MAYRGINIETAIKAIEDDYTAIGSAMTHGRQDGYRVVDYVLRILKAHHKKVVSDRKKKRTQSVCVTLDSEH